MIIIKKLFNIIIFILIFFVTAAIVNGADAAMVTPDDISATELMMDPNPKNYENGTDPTKRHWHDNMNGLYYKNTDKVKNSKIYKLGIGASKWRTNIK